MRLRMIKLSSIGLLLVLFTTLICKAQEMETGKVSVSLLNRFFAAAPNGEANFVLHENGELFARIGLRDVKLGDMQPTAPPPPPPATVLANLDSVHDFEEASHPNDAWSYDDNGIIVCSLRNAHLGVRDLRLMTWVLPGADPFAYRDQDFYPSSGCWFTTHIRIPQMINNINWINPFQLKSAVGRYGSHEPIFNIALKNGGADHLRATFWDYLPQQTQGEAPIPIGEWVKLEMYVESHQSNGYAECYVGGQLIGVIAGRRTSHNGAGLEGNGFPMFGIGHYGSYNNGSGWTDIEFKNTTVTLDRVP